MNEIDILMDELLKDVEVNVAAEPTVKHKICAMLKELQRSATKNFIVKSAGSDSNKAGEFGLEHQEGHLHVSEKGSDRTRGEHLRNI